MNIYIIYMWIYYRMYSVHCTRVCRLQRRRRSADQRIRERRFQSEAVRTVDTGQAAVRTPPRLRKTQTDRRIRGRTLPQHRTYSRQYTRL